MNRNNNWTSRTPSPENISATQAEMKLRYDAYDTIIRQERNKQSTARIGDSIPSAFGNVFSIIGWLVFLAFHKNKLK